MGSIARSAFLQGSILALAGTMAAAQSSATSGSGSNVFYSQCGGSGYTGSTACPAGSECTVQGDYYSQCLPSNSTTAADYAQCGGSNFTGTTTCASGWSCVKSDDYYSQCRPAYESDGSSGSAASATSTLSSTASAVASSILSSAASVSSAISSVVNGSSASSDIPAASPATSTIPLSSALSSAESSIFEASSSSSSDIEPSSSSSSSVLTSSSSSSSIIASSAVESAVTDIVATTTSSNASSTASSAATSSVSSAASSAANSSTVPSSAASTTASSAASTSTASASTSSFLGGVNLAGMDFGCGTDGTCGASSGWEQPDISQVKHFVDEGANVFRVPFGWQGAVGGVLSGPIIDSFWDEVDAVVQAALTDGSYVILDCHNYARWNGAIIGQGSTATDGDLADLWQKIATKYSGEDKIIFGIMNEPHNLDMGEWATTVQTVVTAIRGAEATTQMILIPGAGYSWATCFLPGCWDNSAGNEASLAGVYDVDKTGAKIASTDFIVYDLHDYLDSDESGTSNTCSTDLASTWTDVAATLKTAGRKAFVSEIGGGQDTTCVSKLDTALGLIQENSDVYIGFTAWSAGAFPTTYTLSLTPDGDTDTAIFAAVKCHLPGASCFTGTSSKRSRMHKRVRGLNSSKRSTTHDKRIRGP